MYACERATACATATMRVRNRRGKRRATRPAKSATRRRSADIGKCSRIGEVGITHACVRACTTLKGMQNLAQQGDGLLFWAELLRLLAALFATTEVRSAIVRRRAVLGRLFLWLFFRSRCFRGGFAALVLARREISCHSEANLEEVSRRARHDLATYVCDTLERNDVSVRTRLE
jgi:hypothetical protein